MPAVTISWLMDFESRMQKIVEAEYLRLTASENMWWDLVTRVRPSASGRELLAWILNTAYLVDQGQGGNFDFEDPVMLETEFTNKTAGKALRLRRQQFEDLDGNGVDFATEWSAQMGAQHGYWPQRQIAQLIKDGETGTTYDGLAYFHTAHYNNGRNSDDGTFANLLTGTGYKIDATVTLDVAAQNLAKVYAKIRALKMPNGKDPRMLRPLGILCGPALYPRAGQVTDAKFLAVAAASGGGAADFSGYMARMGYGKVTEASEFVENEYDTSYFVVAEQIGTSQLGGLVYVDREPFSIRYYTGRGGGVGVDAILDRTDVLEWHTSGRNVAGYGHPFLLFKVKPV
jgi:hypothetical protein